MLGYYTPPEYLYDEEVEEDPAMEFNRIMNTYDLEGILEDLDNILPLYEEAQNVC